MSLALSLVEEIEALEAPCPLVDVAVCSRATGDIKVPIPLYTASVDAALTAIPKGWELIQLNLEGDGSWIAHLRCPSNLGFGWLYRGKHKLMQLAVLQAAMKARA